MKVTPDAIVACPHSETNVNAAGIPFSGYPGLLARLTGTPEDKVFLMLVGGGLRIVHVTLHERHSQCAGAAHAGPDRGSAARLRERRLRQLNVNSPRIGMFGINPHAGENGLFGDDDDTDHGARCRSGCARPACIVEGPVGADLMLGRQAISTASSRCITTRGTSR